MKEEKVKQTQEKIRKAIPIVERFENTDKGIMTDQELYGDPSKIPESREQRVF